MTPITWVQQRAANALQWHTQGHSWLEQWHTFLVCCLSVTGDEDHSVRPIIQKLSIEYNDVAVTDESDICPESSWAVRARNPRYWWRFHFMSFRIYVSSVVLLVFLILACLSAFTIPNQAMAFSANNLSTIQNDLGVYSCPQSLACDW